MCGIAPGIIQALMLINACYMHIAPVAFCYYHSTDITAFTNVIAIVMLVKSKLPIAVNCTIIGCTINREIFVVDLFS